AGRAPESLTTVGDYAIFHWVRSRLGAGLPRSPQDSAGPKGSRTLEFLSFSGPTQAWAEVWIGSLAIATGREKATQPHKFQADNGRPRARGALNSSCDSTQRRGSRRARRACGPIVERFGALTGRKVRFWPGR